MKNKLMAIGVILLMVMVSVSPVVAGGYKPISQFTMNGFGTLSVTDLCQHNLLSKEMYIQRVVDGSFMPPFTNGARVDKLFYDKFEKVPGSLDVELGHDGKFVQDLAAGIYGIRLADGDKGQSEYAIVQIFDGQISRVVFVGHAVSNRGKPQELCIPKLTIDNATYGSTDCAQVIDVPEHTEYRYWISGVPAHTEYSYRDYVVDVPGTGAWTEVNSTYFPGSTYVVDTNETGHYELYHPAVPEVPAYTEVHDYNFPGSTYVVDTQEVGHYELYHPAVPEYYSVFTEPTHTGHAKVVTSGWYDFKINGVKYEVTGNGNDPMYLRTGCWWDYDYSIVNEPTHDGHAKLKTTCGGGETCFTATDGKLYKVYTGSGDPTQNGYNMMYTYTPGVDAYIEVHDYNFPGSTYVVDTPEVGHYELFHPAIPEVPAYTETSSTYFEGSTYVVDKPEVGHYELFHPAVDTTYKWTDWTLYSDTPVDPIPDQREVRTRFVPDDMVNGTYSAWSDVPEGSCAQVTIATVAPVNVPCDTRLVSATYKNDPECAVIDVTADVQSVVDGGTTTFMFVDGTIIDIGQNVVASFTDPAPRAVNGGSITFSDGCGNTDTIGFVEGELITIGFQVPQLA